MKDFLTDTWHLYLRQIRLTQRMPIFLVLSIMQPVLWMLLFGQLFRAIIKLPGFGTDSYIQYIAPGVAIMTALFSSSYSGIGMLRDIDSGILDRLLSTPVSRNAVVASRVLQAATQVALQAAVLVVIALAMGARPQGGLPGLLLVFLGAALLAASLASTSCGLAFATRRQEMLIATMNFIILPMTFLSSMIMAPDLMPEWIRAASRFNPVDWAVVTARLGFEGRFSVELATHLAQLLGFTALCALFVSVTFRRYQRSA
ncbi:MAG: ABC transporter permease [Acidobacteriota bacterium]